MIKELGKQWDENLPEGSILEKSSTTIKTAIILGSCDYKHAEQNLGDNL